MCSKCVYLGASSLHLQKFDTVATQQSETGAVVSAIPQVCMFGQMERWVNVWSTCVPKNSGSQRKRTRATRDRCDIIPQRLQGVTRIAQC